MRPGSRDVNPAYDAPDSRLRRTAQEEERMTQRRVTLADVARRAGLSTTAASRVLNGREGTRLSDDARRRVLAAAEELGYRPNVAARSLRLHKTATIALISDTVATTRFAGG